ncbi:MAG TPA: hypothetical protein VK797_13480 [Tepidisphaeraceae bacterium]|nr:hypothetical protein [Tepidisphaeraceae bacterium]
MESLRDATVAGLTAAHDHFVYTKKVWRIVDVEVRRRGRKIVLSNTVTGTRLTETDLLPVAHASVNDYLPSATIQQFASLTETFLTDLVRLWLTAYPMHLKGQVDVQTIVAAPDKAAILRPLIDQHVLSMSYKRPSEWFRLLNGIVALNHPSDSEIEQFAEFKASRDVFVHNRGIVTEVYLDKAGGRARAALGRPLDLPDPYLHDGWRLCRKIVTDVGTAAALKA